MRVDEALLDTDGRIDPARWQVALAAEATVGSCHCGMPAVPGPIDVDYFGRRSFPLYCLTDPDHESVVPAARVVRQPSTVHILGLGQHEVILQAGRERDAAILGERLAS